MTTTKHIDLWDSLDDCLFEVLDDVPGSQIKPGTPFKTTMRFDMEVVGNMDFNGVNTIMARLSDRINFFITINNLKSVTNFKHTGYMSVDGVIQQFGISINIKIK